MAHIFAYIVHEAGKADDTALELYTAAKKIDASAPVIAIITGQGEELNTVASELACVYDEVWKYADGQLSHPNAETIRPLLVSSIPADSVVLMAHNTFGMDLAPGLSIKLDEPFLPDVTEIKNLEGHILKVIRQELGGQVGTHVEADISGGLVITTRAGSFAPTDTNTTGKIIDKSQKIETQISKRRFIKMIAPEVGDVDITKENVLVSIGRGIEDEDNIEIAQELADAMGAVVSCSRPIVDAKWLGNSRQVGTSGKTVKPKVYLACGISGSFQHMGGIKGSPFIVAINKNPNAPIFQMADVGIKADILDFLPKLTEAITETNKSSR
ncbi:MAG: electron transfer flavoprotein subunit alpha/FixB family protein [Desulfoplanes sp.]